MTRYKKVVKADNYLLPGVNFLRLGRPCIAMSREVQFVNMTCDSYGWNAGAHSLTGNGIDNLSA
jgi:hypothetical protein